MGTSTPTPLSRRSLLRRTAATAFAASAPSIVPARTLGLGRHVAPSERITVGLVGLGNIAKGHFAAALNDPALQILAVCDVDRTKREQRKAEVENAYAQRAGSGTYKGCAACNEHERVTRRSDIDVCYVLTPDHWHVPIALDAIRSGKDVYVEKPLTLTVREGRMLADTVRRHGAVLQVGSQQRSGAEFRKAAEMVRNGWIGKVKEVYARLGDFPPAEALPEERVPDGFDYDRWLGPTPWQPYHSWRVSGSFSGGWRCFWEYGSRKNGDWGAHHYDIIQWALGMDHAGPVFFFPKGFEGSPWQGYRYADGTTVYRDRKGESGQMIEFVGEKGMVAVSRSGVLLSHPAELKNRPPTPADTQLYESSNHKQNFFDCVRTRKRPIADVETGHRTATICHLSAISERLDRPLRWDPGAEQILDDAVAARWLDRPRRAPYTL